MNHKLITLVMAIAVIASLVLIGCAPEAAPPEEGAPPAAPEEPTAPAAEELPTWDLRITTIDSVSDMEDRCGEWRDDIYQMTGGRVSMHLYSTYELIPDEQVMPAMKAGTIDGAKYMCWCNPELTQTGWVEGALPYSLDNPTEFNVLFWFRGLKEIFEEDYANYGVKYVCPWHCDASSTVISTRPIEKLEDFQGLKISTFEPLGGYCWGKAGAQLVSVPADEMYLAGKTGTLDAVGWGGAHQYYMMGLEEAFPYYLANSACGTLATNVIWNQEVWDSFGPEIQTMIECASIKASIKDSARKYDGESWGREPYEVTRLSDEDEAVLKQYAYEYWDELAQRNAVSAKVVQIYKDYVKELEATKWHREGVELPF